jgi:phenylacetate-CoA ligase
MNLPKNFYFALVALRGQALGKYYERFLRETQEGIPPDTSRNLLIQLLTHCKQSVPYYSKIMNGVHDSFENDPVEYLKDFPFLSKEIIRGHFDELKSLDLGKRKWFTNTSSGSTGEPIYFIQDLDNAARRGAVKLLYSKLVGKEIGEPEIRLWGSIHDIKETSESIRARLITRLEHINTLDAFRMTPVVMREYIRVINTKKPKLILAYAESMYLLASFAEREGLQVLPQQAIMTSAGMLYPHMREKIERVFQCRVFNRYGSREVGDTACERPGYDGLWVAPWLNYVEIVDKDGNRVPDGTEGEILITSLTNYSMPLIRYKIGDLGILAPKIGSDHDSGIQVLQSILGRTTDSFKTKEGTLLSGGNFILILYNRDWIAKFQIIQKSLTQIIYRIVKAGIEPQPIELDDIVSKTKRVMGKDCEVLIEFVDEIPETRSGKFRFTFTEVPD